jgi:hypothetical protein
VIDKTFNELKDHDPNGDSRALQRWLEQLAMALKGSCANKKADALATLATLRRGGAAWTDG